MAAKIEYPRAGSERTVAFAEEPVRLSKETDEEFAKRVAAWESLKPHTLTVRVLRAPRRDSLRSAVSIVMQKEAKRLEAHRADGVLLTATPEGVEEQAKLARDILEASLVSMSSLPIGESGLRLAQVEKTELIDLLEALGLAWTAALRCLRAQGLSAEEFRFFG